eukprot:145864_1
MILVNSVLAMQIIEVMERKKWVMLCWRWIWDQDLMLRILLHVGNGSGFDVAQITAGAYHTCALSTSGGVKCFGWNLYGQLGLGDRNNRGDGANEMGDALLEVDFTYQK